MTVEAVMTEEKLQEVAAYVRSKYKPQHRDEAGQIAYLAARKWRDDYRRRTYRQAFGVASAVAFRATTQALRRQWATVSISDHVAEGRRKPAVDIGSRDSLFRKSEDGKGRDERFAGEPEAAPEIGLRGELDRLTEVVRLFRKLGEREKKLLTIVMGNGRTLDLGTLAKRAKLDREQARRVLERFSRAVGPDPVVAHVARVVSRP